MIINTDDQGSQLPINRVHRHFKGKYYYVFALAKHTETEELMVVYQALYGSHQIFVRPYNMFIEEVPEGKENPTGQRYRFEPCQL
ncbi:DUF1653 domain-containing protein [Peptococcaceae bacterium 1198_IL3148]